MSRITLSALLLLALALVVAPQLARADDDKPSNDEMGASEGLETREAAFDNADDDKDGKLSPDELGVAIKTLGLAVVNSKPAQGAMGRLSARVLDSVGLLYWSGTLANFFGIIPGTPAFDMLFLFTVTAIYSLLVIFGYQVS